jgi:hypothetical protein
MAGDASWWDNPEAQGSDTPVIRHAPDSHNYHVPDSDQLYKMRGSKVGRFAVIPAANKDGTSKAFDPTVAGPVHVDPDAPDGGVIFDPDMVRKQDVNRVVAQSYYPHQAFYALGTPAPLLGVGTKKQAAFVAQQEQNGFGVDRGPNPHMPNTYVVPSASTQPGRLSEVPAYHTQRPAQEEFSVNGVPPLASLPPIPTNIPVPVQAPVPAPATVPPQPPQFQQPPAYYQPPAPYQPPPMDPNMAAMMHAMVGLQQQVAALAQRPQMPQLPPTTGVSQNPMPVGRPLTTQPIELQRNRTAVPQYQHPDSGEYDDETARPIRRVVKRNKEQEIEDQYDEVHGNERHEADEPPQQTVRAYNERQNGQPEAVIAGFETLNLKFVTGPLPHKAKKQVIFEIPGAGKNLAKFHDVIDGGGCVVLVYDTRYDDGYQYVPPELGAETVITMHVKTGKDKMQTFRVASMGLHYSFGVFDHIVMVKAGGEGVDYGGEDEDE